MKKLLDTLLAGKPAWFINLAGLLLLVLIGIVDYLTGYEISTFIFFAIPIALVSWYGGNKCGYTSALLSILIWAYVDKINGHLYTAAFIFYWNGAVRLAFFLLVAYWMSLLNFQLIKLNQLASVDALTGCLNKFAFHQKCDNLLLLSQRFKQPISLGFIDLDNFKQVNDTKGHSTGDFVLGTIANTMMKSVRHTDIVARLGGDEFAILLPNTDIDSAKTVFENLRSQLANEVRQHQWPIGFSIGVVTFHTPSLNTDRAIGIADALMYRVKKNGKNSIAYEIAPDWPCKR